VLVQVIVADLLVVRSRFVPVIRLLVLSEELSGISVQQFREHQSIVSVAIREVLSDRFVVCPPLVDVRAN